MSGLLIRGARLFDPSSRLDVVGDLLLQDNRIAGVGEVEAVAGVDVIEASGLWALPGLMDLHVHLREPGQEHKETIATGTRAAAAGGFTTVVCEPNTTPPGDTAARITEELAIAARDAVVQVRPKCAITLEQQGREVTDFTALRQAGAVAASDDGFAVADDAVMRAAFMAAKSAGLPLTLHVEGPEMVARDIGLCTELGWPVHFSHVSLAEEAELIARARAHGLPVTGEVAPHHLALTFEDAPPGDANFKMNPSLGDVRDRAAVRAALASGVLTVIASDHAPHAVEEKSYPYDQAPPGVIGLETTLGVLWTHLVQEESESPETIIKALTSGPAAVLGVAAPRLAVGAPAEVALFDPKARWTVDPSRFQSKGRNCPFAGWKLQGRAVATIVGGRVVMREGEIIV